MIVDIGGGTTDIAVISLGSAVESTSLKVAGDDFNDAIVKYMRKNHSLSIGERTAEDVKIKIGTCFRRPEVDKMEVKGRHIVKGLPTSIEVTSEEMEEALEDSTNMIVDAIISGQTDDIYDVNYDGEINIADINEIVNMILAI